MANANEAQSRIKINKLLEGSGWRFEDSSDGKANIQLEAGVKFSDLGDDLENAVSRSGAGLIHRLTNA
jgi:type I restriction enzyme R subunit